MKKRETTPCRPPLDEELCHVVLCAFQDQEWPAWIDDPVPEDGHPDPAARLENVVHWLNDACRASTLRFRCHGRRIGWYDREFGSCR
jgi:hypothetical protein